MILTARYLDGIVEESLRAFTRDVFREGWRGKEHDCVNRYVHGYLLNHCSQDGPLTEYTQIGIEVAVAQPPGFDKRRSVRRDVVIWRKPNGTCWRYAAKDDPLVPDFHPASIIEWKVRRGVPSEVDKAWLLAYSSSHMAFVGYAVTLDFSNRKFQLHVARIRRGVINVDWLIIRDS